MDLVMFGGGRMNALSEVSEGLGARRRSNACLG